MHKGQVVVGSIGGAMFASFLTTAQMYYSTPLTNRSDFIFRLMIVSASSCAIATGLWMYLHFKSDKTTQPTFPAQPINITVSPNISPTFTNSPTITQSPEVTTVPTTQVLDSPPSESELEFKFIWGELVFDTIPGYWRAATPYDYAKNPRKSLLVSVTRKVPPRGSPHKDVKLTASIKFVRGSSFEHQQCNAYWLTSEFSEQDFTICHEGFLIVGSCEENQFASYENKWPRPRFEILEIISRIRGPRKSLSQNGTVDCEISLIDTVRRETMVQKKFSIIFSPKTSPIIFEGL
jgi:hypothetical protein